MRGRHPRLAATLANLGVALHDRYRLSDEPADLQEAAELTERALGIDGDDADHARRWFARALVARTAADVGADRAREAAVQAYREGCRIGLVTDPESTLIAAQDWGGWASARRDRTGAAEAYPFALDAAAVLVTTQVVRDHQEPGCAPHRASPPGPHGRSGRWAGPMKRTSPWSAPAPRCCLRRCSATGSTWPG